MKRILLVVVALAQLAAAQAAKPLTIEAIFAEGGITGRAPETLEWSPDGTKLSFVQRDDAGERGALWFVDVTNGNKAVLVTEQTLAKLQPPVTNLADEREKERITRYSVAGYHWAPNSQHLLFDANGQLWLYTLANGTAVQITSAPEPSSEAQFAPDGKHISYVRNHNLYLHSVTGDSEKRLTLDGAEDLLNGEVDWLYAEELDVRANYFWSPDSQQILSLQTNEKRVPKYPITDWIPTHPQVEQERYPKAGDPNPAVRLQVIDLASGKGRWLIEKPLANDVYLPRFGFVRPSLAWAEVLNRAQTHMDLYLIDTQSGHASVILSEDEPQAWIEVTDNIHFSKNGDRLLLTSWRDGHQHIYLYALDTNNPMAPAKLERQLTKGDYEVFSIDQMDEGRVYFTANIRQAMERQIFAVPLSGGEPQPISREAGTHKATFAPGQTKYYADSFSALASPPAMALCTIEGACNAFWKARSVADYQLIAPKVLQLQAADKTTTLYGTLLLPPQATGKIPVILNPYGGPGSQNVVNAWSSGALFDQILARRGFAVLRVDNRGMAARGKAFAVASRGKFGTTELSDQLGALDQVLAATPQLDANRIGWWGWSYGGYMTLYAMTHSPRIKAGVAVAPVTDWRNYDTTYTERYMGLPDENRDGYANASPVNAAGSLIGRVLIVHGTSDDNVHLQNTMQMVNALINANRPFDLQLYPRKTHGIAGQAARVHLFNRIQQQFETYLGGSSPVAADAPSPGE